MKIIFIYQYTVQLIGALHLQTKYPNHSCIYPNDIQGLHSYIYIDHPLKVVLGKQTILKYFGWQWACVSKTKERHQILTSSVVNFK